MKRLLAVLCVTALLGCGDGPSTDLTKAEHVLRMQLEQSPETLDPRDARSLVAHTISKMLFDGLTRIDAMGKPVPSIAQQIDLSDDGLTYTFILRESYWTDGFPVTAYDFEYAWRSVLHPDSPSTAAATLFPIRGAQAAKEGLISMDEVGIVAEEDGLALMYLEGIPNAYYSLWTDDELEWAAELFGSRRWASLRARFFEIEGLLEDEPRGPTRSALVEELFALGK